MYLGFKSLPDKHCPGKWEKCDIRYILIRNILISQKPHLCPDKCYPA